jgi:hypothetical protein
MKKIILVEEFRANLENGISDKALMRKYGLSEKGLKKLIDRLFGAISSGSRHIEAESEE